MSPEGKVPVLVDGGGVIYESAIINEYLEDAYPEVPLMPSDAHGRAQVRLWNHFISNRLVPAQSKVRRSDDPGEVQAHWPVLREHVAALERHLAATAAEGPWFLGAALTLADINAIPFVMRLTWIRGLDVAAEYPALGAWYAAFCQRPSFRATHPPE